MRSKFQLRVCCLFLADIGLQVEVQLLVLAQQGVLVGAIDLESV
jgi:hypothetical protein